jgi:hypothetical protein
MPDFSRDGNSFATPDHLLPRSPNRQRRRLLARQTTVVEQCFGGAVVASVLV